MDEFKKSGAIAENQRIWKAVDALSNQALLEATEKNARHESAERQLGQLDAYGEVRRILLAMKW